MDPFQGHKQGAEACPSCIWANDSATFWRALCEHLETPSPCCQDTFLILSSGTWIKSCILFLENRQSTISCFLKNTCNFVAVLSPTVLISSCFNRDAYVDAYPPMITPAHTVRQWCRKSFPPQFQFVSSLIKALPFTRTSFMLWRSNDDWTAIF